MSGPPIGHFIGKSHIARGVHYGGKVNALIQVEGAGGSFTSSRWVAESFLNHQFNPYFFEHYANIYDRDEQKRLLKTHLSWMSEEDIEKTLIKDSYSCVGTYKLKKQDMIMVKAGPEQEIVCDPNNVDIHRYDFLTFAEALASNYAHQWFNNVNGSKMDDGKTPLMAWNIDEDEIGDLFLKFTKQIYDRPELIKLFFANKNNHDDFFRTNLFGLLNFLSLDDHGRVIGMDKLQEFQEQIAEELKQKAIEGVVGA